ncbi:hypothetical protein [Romboutsia ilealis]|uniref:hypothetical protein n=1 Tax=Romboutsia ilealis TaxID=1115758 RepID=UPI00272AD279|nr:hypothetical protein [Romboutsia ilealis]
MIKPKNTKDNFIYVDDWIPKSEDYTVYFDNKLIVIPFDKIFNQNFGNDNTFCSFVINRTIYSNNIEKVCKYINYFCHFYDEEKELVMNYVKLKFIIDDKKRKVKKNAFIKAIYDLFFTDSIIEKIDKMVEDNFRVNLKKEDVKKYDEAMEFTNEHGKILFKISVATNLLIPVLNHYLYSRNSDEKILYDYYVHLFDIFDPEGVDMINKLSNYTLYRVTKNYEGNKRSWEQRDMLGDKSYLAYADIVLQKIVVTDVIPKFTFNLNIVSLLTVVLENNLNFYNRGEYKYLPVVLNDKKDVEGLSDLDKFEMSFNKIDESISILSDCNIERVIKKIEIKNRIEISEEELKFYEKHHVIGKFQVTLVKYYYAKYFNGYRDLNMLKVDQYMKLLIILKRRLQAQGYIYLPQILTGNIEGKLNTRTIQNRKFIDKIQTSVLYNQLIDTKFSYLIDLKNNNIILNTLSTILNTSFSIVEYNNQEKLGERIDVIADIVSEEVLEFLNQI